MCGIAGLFLGRSRDRAAIDLLEAAFLLQHRGQDACGIASANQDGDVYRYRNLGLASEVFANPRNIQELEGHIGLLHLRYGTAGTYSLEEAQPLYSKAASGIFLAHNGNLVNSTELRGYLGNAGFSCSNNRVDSGLLLDILSANLQSITSNYSLQIEPSAIISALEDVYRYCKGSFACIAMLAKKVLVGFRDSHGIKPLVYGERRNADGSHDYMFASESVALEKLGFVNIRDVRPGEAILVFSQDKNSKVPQLVRWQVAPMLSYTPDIFEYVYLARPESIIDNISVHCSRQKMGIALAETIIQQLTRREVEEIDVVIPVPETSCTAALSVSKALKKEYSHGILKNGYIHRTFIMPEQTQRQRGVLRKLNAVRAEFDGRTVLVVDDSIVRGTTSKAIVQMAREAGAKKVIFASASPPIKFNHVYGVNLADNQDLIAHSRTNQEICEAIGSDQVIYLPFDKLIDCCLGAASSPIVNSFEVGIFTGKYITGGADEYLQTVNRPGRKMLAKALLNLAAATGETVVEYFPRNLITSMS